MTVHKNTRLDPIQRKEIYRAYHEKQRKVTDLAREYHVSRPTIYKVIARGRQNDFSVHRSVNARFRCLKYGIKRLTKIERSLEIRLKSLETQINRNYPGKALLCCIKLLPALKGKSAARHHEYLFVATDDFSRELYAAILPDKTVQSARAFLEQIIEECPYTIERYCSNLHEIDNRITHDGEEYRGDPEHHAFVHWCTAQGINRRSTPRDKSKVNGKAERAIKAIMERWHNGNRFTSSTHRKTALKRFIRYYNGVRPHKALGGLTPEEFLIQYFYPEVM